MFTKYYIEMNIIHKQRMISDNLVLFYTNINNLFSHMIFKTFKSIYFIIFMHKNKSNCDFLSLQ